MATITESASSADPKLILQQRFGLNEFRPGQLHVIQALLADRSAAAVFPTGGGKSLCYQLPALLLPGVTLVVSPLIALMKDQCDALAQRGIRAGRLDSSLSGSELSETMQAVRSGAIKILYVAPERFFNERFRAVVDELSISLFAIDEAHCISQWGHNFRPDYLKLADLTRQLSIPRVLALTATATPSVLKDIQNAFSIKPADVVQTQFFRPNLQIFSRVVSEDKRDEALLDVLRSRPTGPTLIYVTLQKTTAEVTDLLNRHGFEARAYHAGMDTEQRSDVQNWFLPSKTAIVVATIAFGMGIDKPDIRYVYHYNLSKSIESYGQEIGRAGRDGEDSVCETFLVPSDRTVLENFSYGDTPDRAGIQRLVEIIRGQSDPFFISHHKLSSETDIRILVVRTLLTYLELDGYIQGLAPRYDTYQFKPLVTSKTILSHFQGERRRFISDLLCTAVKRKTLFEIPLSIAVQRLKQPRERLVKAIDYLSERGWIELKVSNVVFGYKKLIEISNSDELTEELYERLRCREEGEIHRLNELQTLLSAPSCQAALLSNHFGQRLEQACGRCTSCMGEGPLELPAVSGGGVGRSALVAIRQLAASKPEVLGSPRAQARLLCGLTSPAFVKARLTKDPLFGVCESVPFLNVLAQLTD